MDNQEVQVKFVRLNTGEDLVSEVVFISEPTDEAEPHFVLVRPFKLVYSVVPHTGNVAVSLMEWVFSHISDEQKFIVYPESVLTISDASPELEVYYHKSLASLAMKRGDVASLLGIYNKEEDQYEDDYGEDDDEEFLDNQMAVSYDEYLNETIEERVARRRKMN